MRHRFALLALLATLVLAAAGCGGDPPPDPPAAAPTTTTAPGPEPTTAPEPTRVTAARSAPSGVVPADERQPAPGIDVTDFGGRTIALGGFRGQPVVVNFFESWWVVCRAEQPGLGQVARDFEGKVQFFGVSYNDTVSEGRKYQREFEVPYPLANDASGRTWAAYRVPYQPVTVVVDERGRVARRFDGGVEPEQLAPVLEYLVGT